MKYNQEEFSAIKKPHTPMVPQHKRIDRAPNKPVSSTLYHFHHAHFILALL